MPKIGFSTYSDFNFAKNSVNYTPSFYSILGCKRELDSSIFKVGPQGEFSVQNLLSRGFDVQELPIVNKVRLMEFLHNLKYDKVDSKTGEGSFLIESKSELVKNKILENVFNNIQSIYESKGTEAASRNLIRCFGANEKLVAPNVYINN